MTSNTRAFHHHLKYYKHLLTIGGLRSQTSIYIVCYIRLSIFAFFIFTLFSTIYQFSPEHNIYSNITFLLLHFWVLLSFELWRRFTNTHHWRTMMGIIIKHQSKRISKLLNIVGFFALVFVIFMILMIYVGYVYPTINQLIMHANTMSSSTYIYLIFYSVCMLIFVPAYSSTCVCSVFLFFLLTLTHESDMENLFEETKKMCEKNRISYLNRHQLQLLQQQQIR
jgi:hypothetical protein